MHRYTSGINLLSQPHTALPDNKGVAIMWGFQGGRRPA